MMLWVRYDFWEGPCSSPSVSDLPAWDPSAQACISLADLDTIVEAIIYYLDRENERRRITDCAYHYVTEEPTMGNGVRRILETLNRT